MLPEYIDTGFGHALAPLQLSAARQHTQMLSRKHGESGTDVLEHLKPHYLDEGYQPRGWHRSIHLVPAATPRSSYSHPLAGGVSQDELDSGTYDRLARSPKEAEKMPFFQDREPPQPGHFRLGTDDDQSDPDPSAIPTLIWERLVPHRRSRKADAKVVVAAHGLGFCKETWLPLLDQLIASDHDDHGIAEVWLVDALGHGMTAVYNASSIHCIDSQQLLSSTHRIVDSNDYARDLLQFLTCYLPSALESTRHEAAAPLPTVLPYAAPRSPARRLVGIGHSFGATSLLQSCVHLPDLFESLCVVEPILVREALADGARRVPLAKLTLLKPDEWPSRSAAMKSFAKDRMLSTWDTRVQSAFAAGALCPIQTQTSQSNQGSANEGQVQRCCNRVCEALCIRGNRPGIQLATQTLRYVPHHVRVLYISCAKPLLLPLQEVEQTARTNIANLVFEAHNGSHGLPLEHPNTIANSIRNSLLASLFSVQNIRSARL